MATIVNRFGTWYFQATNGKRISLRTKNKKLAQEFFAKYKKIVERKTIIGMIENLIKAEYGSHKVTGVVYFIQSQKDELVKVGYSKDVEKRFKALQTSSPDKLKLIGKIMGNRNTEKYIHIKLNGSRKHGEWFEPSKEMMQLIDLFGIEEIEDITEITSDPRLEQAIISFENHKKKRELYT